MMDATHEVSTPHLGDVEVPSSSPAPFSDESLSTTTDGGGKLPLPTLSPDDVEEEAAAAAARPAVAPTKRSTSPIVKLLEVENELRKQEAENGEGGFDRIANDDDGGRPGEHAQRQLVAVSDSEHEANHYDGGGEDEEEEEEWEDFMADYWQSVPATEITPSQAESLLAAEDTDLRPCAMEPELDEEPNALSSIRTGCMDIDMDFNAAHGEDDARATAEDADGMERLSGAGLECSLAMARVLGKEGGRKANAMEGLRINLGRVDGGSPGNQGGVKQRNVQTKSNAAPTADRISKPVATATATPVTPRDALDARNLSSVRGGSAQDLTSNASFSRSFDVRSDVSLDIEKKSTRSSTAASEATSANGAAGDWKHKTSPLPSSEMILMTAPILARTSLRSLVMKKWHPSYWMHYGPTRLLIFRSKDHMDDWRYNPYHGRKQRDFLVKLHVDFLKDMEQDGNSKEGVLGHRILPVKKKSYGKNEEEMYQFKLERWTNLGCSVLAAFASQEEDEVQILHDTISEMLRSCPNNGLRNIDHMLK